METKAVDSADELDLPQASLMALTGAVSPPRNPASDPSDAAAVVRWSGVEVGGITSGSSVPYFPPAPDKAASNCEPGVARASVGSSPPVADPQESDIWADGFCGRAMLPGFLACVAITAGALFIFYPWLVQTLAGQRELANSAVLALVGAAWVFQVFRWAYRTISVRYRLTNRRLFIHHGCLYGEEEVVDLTRLTRVDVCRNPFEWLVGVGRVRLISEGTNAAAILLSGIRRPIELAHQIRQQILNAREASVRAARVAVD